MGKQVLLTERAALAVANTVRQVRQVPPNRTSFRARRLIMPQSGIPVYNNSGSQVPAYGVMKPSAMSAGVITIVKPDTSLSQVYLLNGPNPINAASSGTALEFGDVLIGTLSAAIGDGWGVTPGSFVLTKNYPTIFTCFGDDGTNARGVLAPITTIIGKLAGTLAQGGTATVNVYAGTGGSETWIGSMTIAARDWLMKSGATAIASGKKVACQFINGICYVTEAECA